MSTELQTQIIAAIGARSHPCTMIELVEATGCDYWQVGQVLTKMYRANVLSREKVRRDDTQRTYYAYQIANKD